jgi:hypothetical protein
MDLQFYGGWGILMKKREIEVNEKTGKTETRCSSCGQWFPKEDFYYKKNERQIAGVTSNCRTCLAINTCLSGAKARSYTKSISYEIDIDWARNQLVLQDHRCWWTRQEFDFGDTEIKGLSKYNSLTIDRIDNNEGYTMENSVFVVYWFNTFKGSHNFPELNQKLLGCINAFSVLQTQYRPVNSLTIKDAHDLHTDEFITPTETSAMEAKFKKELEEGKYDDC